MRRDLLATDINNSIIGRKQRPTKKKRATRQKKLVVQETYAQLVAEAYESYVNLAQSVYLTIPVPPRS